VPSLFCFVQFRGVEDYLRHVGLDQGALPFGSIKSNTDVKQSARLNPRGHCAM
jgi:hypothetical protein